MRLRRVDEHDVRGRHVRDPDDAGLRALREGSAREADVSRRCDAQPGSATTELPYDVTAWSLGMLFGVDVDFVDDAAAAGAG